MNAFLSGVKRFADIDSSSRKRDEVEDILYSLWKVLECVGRDNHSAIEWGGEPEMEDVVD